jgi:1,4-dihydroxy-2-naphthoate octaprenyltransferase
MTRPDQLLLMVVVYGAGVAAAVARGAAPDARVAAVGFLVFLPVAASVHLANEYADHETDRLTRRTRFSGGSGALVRYGVDRRVALGGAVAALGVGAVAALGAWALGALGGASLAALAVVAAFGWGYSLPPLALAWRGLGEVDNAALGGVVLPVYGVSVAAGSLPAWAVPAFLPFGCVVFVNLLATTWPDRRADAAVGKRTLATRLAPGRLRALFGVGALAAVGSAAAFHGNAIPAPVCFALGAAFLALLPAGALYTRVRTPFPTVAAMVGAAVVQLLAWAAVADLVPVLPL